MEMAEEKGKGNPIRGEIEKLIEAGNLRDLLYKAGELHGHLCSHLAYGVKAGYIAMRELGVKSRGMEEIVAIIETNNCFSDGIQMVTGCSFGNNALVYRDFGKTAVTVAKRDGTAIRIALNPNFEGSREKEYPEAHELFDKIVAKREKATPEEHKRLMQLFAEMSITELNKQTDELFIIKRLEIVVPEYAPIFDSVKCSICGENVMKTRAVTENGESLCIPCSNRGYFQMDGSGISVQEGGVRGK
ncbi:formylmethanofuran dehydrogenase [Methanophagales archaeon]|nr:MAG: formylmethanofuran dehydrogenase [Methanophagales archaeon]